MEGGNLPKHKTLIVVGEFSKLPRTPERKSWMNRWSRFQIGDFFPEYCYSQTNCLRQRYERLNLLLIQIQSPPSASKVRLVINPVSADGWPSRSLLLLLLVLLTATATNAFPSVVVSVSCFAWWNPARSAFHCVSNVIKLKCYPSASQQICKRL